MTVVTVKQRMHAEQYNHSLDFENIISLFTMNATRR